jgi:uncharacterized integral membrane protein
MAKQPEHRPRVVVRGAGFLWGFVLAVPLAAALIVFIAQNTQAVTVHWTVWKVRSSLAVVVLVAIAVAVLLAELVGLVWRLRRRRLIARQESLRAELADRTATPVAGTEAEATAQAPATEPAAEKDAGPPQPSE